MKLSEMKTSNFDKKDLIVPIVMVILLSIAVGLIIFYITNPMFNKTEDPPFTEKLDLSDENVKILYDYVTYSRDGNRNDVFVTNDTVTKDNMPNKDKLFYALQFANPDDFKSTGKRDKNNNQIFNISDKRIDEYMKMFFGSEVSYSKEKKFNYPLYFGDEYKYIGTLTYSYENNGYDTILTKADEEKEQEQASEKDYVKPFYSKLVSAIKYEDQTLELQEKVIYTKVTKNDDLYTIDVYGDYHYNNLLEKRKNLTFSQMKNSVFDLNEYIETAATITYTFKTENNKYYFYSSVNTNK